MFNPTCAFWEHSEKLMSGGWSHFGCKVHSSNVTHTVCQCQHLTNFAILMDVTGTEVKPNTLQLSHWLNPFEMCDVTTAFVCRCLCRTRSHCRSSRTWVASSRVCVSSRLTSPSSSSSSYAQQNITRRNVKTSYLSCVHVDAAMLLQELAVRSQHDPQEPRLLASHG